ncbi:PilZ domain-containing protein [Salicola sp. Rm-C-2C1-2]|uniref:PilZ domain-containing protein n=1 Tax=Salicola sp. Rm-C-2C1-2 TaxID=3141321 RepID=UPI0032E38023
MPSEHDSERRQFYRIEDCIGLECRQLSGEPTAPADTLFEGGETLPLEEELQRHDAEIRHQIGLLSENDRILSQLARALNEKLDTVARIMAFQKNPLQDSDWVHVTLSEGGLSFATTQLTPTVDARMAVRLTLMPELSQVAAFARVVSLEETGEGTRLHLQFQHMEDAVRQQIARHVLRIQARKRQQIRQRRETGMNSA